MGSSGGSDSKESACNVGDPGSLPGSKKITGMGRSPGEGNGNPFSLVALYHFRNHLHLLII